MSQSPTGSTSQSLTEDYFRNWDALGLMISRGSSFSGRERNCVFLNTSGQRFADVSAASELDFLDDGRAIGLTDWDQDGDVDLWLANRTAPRLRFLRNDIPAANRYLALRLVGRTCNRDAIGARVEVYTSESEPRRLVDTVRAGDGFLTQSTKWLNFGVGRNEKIQRLRIRWPGEAGWEEFDGLATNRRYQISQGTRVATPVKATRARSNLKPSKPQLPVPSDQGRAVLTHRVQFQLADFLGFDQKQKRLPEDHAGPVLLNLWASWCQPCLHELRDFAAHRRELEEAGIAIVALCTDQVGASGSGDLTAAKDFLRAIDFPFQAGVATSDAVAKLTFLLGRIFYKERPLPLPCSFLLDSEGRLAVVYRGPTTVDQLLRDEQLLAGPPAQIDAEAFPAEGHFVFRESGINPLAIVRAYRDGEYLADAKKELEEILLRASDRMAAPESLADPTRRFFVDVYRELATVEAEMGQTSASLEAWQKAAQLDPENPSLVVALAVMSAKIGDRRRADELLDGLVRKSPDDPAVWRMAGHAWLSIKEAPRAVTSFSRALELAADNLQTRFDLGIAYQLQGDATSAIEQYHQILTSDPSWAHAANNLAWIYATDADDAIRNGARAVEFAQQACRVTPNQLPAFLGTLAAAYAEAGQFEEAVQSIRRAIRLAEGTGEDQLASNLQQRLQLHQRRLPYHQPPRGR